MKIKGTETKTVEVNVDSCDAILGLASNYGYAAENYLDPSRDTLTKLVKFNGKYMMESYEDTSYHGSPSYDKKREWELSEDDYKAIQCLKYLYKLEKMKKRERER